MRINRCKCHLSGICLLLRPHFWDYQKYCTLRKEVFTEIKYAFLRMGNYTQIEYQYPLDEKSFISGM